MALRIVAQKKQTIEFLFDGRGLVANVSPEEIRLNVPEQGSIVYNGYHFTTRDTTTVKGWESKHHCGEQGYNPMRGDNCPCCDRSRYVDDAWKTLEPKLLEMKLLAEEYD